ncbi:transmembrane protein, putative [Medicago truncatula]|uniref:Transmembrane protein, putative n=1 Tax=Medicago truncatula TaxID=3880 RepID=A0A072UZ64_MEDTR|nr:transmembrane protein, putative [Medicago truncatula]
MTCAVVKKIINNDICSSWPLNMLDLPNKHGTHAAEAIKTSPQPIRISTCPILKLEREGAPNPIIAASILPNAAMLVIFFLFFWYKSIKK